MITLTKYWRLFLELGLIVALIIVFMLWKANGNKLQTQQTITQAHTVLKTPAAQQNSFKDSSGATHTQFLANSGQIPQYLLKDTAVTNRTFVDTAARVEKIKAAQFLELTKENVALKAENIQLKQKGPATDSVFYYEDKWLQVFYYAITHKADVLYNVNITTGKFTPGTWLPFTHKPPMLDFSADDPRAHINNVEHFTAIIPEPFIGFTGNFKGYYDLDTRQIIPAVSAGIRLGRFHIEDNFYYSQKLKQAIGLSYDFLRVNP